MAVTTTTRLGLTRWSADTDAFSRGQLDATAAALEAKAAGFLKGLFADRPAAAAAYDRFFYLATDNTTLYYCDGSTWSSVGQFGSPSAATPGDSNTDGVATTAARSDHKHSLPSYGVVGELAAVGTVAAAGTTAKFARIDHAHILGTGAVTAGKIAVGGVSAADQIANSIIGSGHIVANSIAFSNLATALQALLVPAGAVLATSGSTADTGWLLLNGQSVANCDSTYPSLWARVPSSWKSSTTLNLPDARGRTLFMDDAASVFTLGALSGSNSITTVPAHTHVMDHTHGSFTTGTGGVHSHTIDHGHIATATTIEGAHVHEEKYFNKFDAAAGSYNAVRPYNSSGFVSGSNDSGSSGSHYHTVTIATSSGLSSGDSSTHTHAVTVTAYSGSTASSGSASVDVTNANLAINWQIKAH